MKTLKDTLYDTEMGLISDPTELKEAAREHVENLWLKEIEENHTDLLREARCQNDGGCGDAGFCISPNKDIIKFIEHFFNLEEEKK